ncbi:MAG: hypothetical protein IBJ03_05820 [Gemmatimonadaceae bacterium]|nr:hypothetical protein [Gemmatimonadaceae bacterium]
MRSHLRHSRALLWAIGLTLTAPLVSACGSDAPTTTVTELRELSRAEALWRNRGFRNYRMELAVSCFCPAEVAATAVVTVHGTTIVDVRYADGRVIPAQYWNGRPVVDSLFVRIRDAIHSDFYDRVELEFDPQVGYPIKAAFTTSPSIADGDAVYTIRAFQPLP